MRCRQSNKITQANLSLSLSKSVTYARINIKTHQRDNRKNNLKLPLDKMSKWAVITGAGTGIGEGLACHLASKGYRVLAVGRREEPLIKVRDKHPDQIVPLPVDIATEEGVGK